MFIIPVAGLAKAVIAVTVSLHHAARRGMGAWPVCGANG